jgi:subtilisin family serine protease
MFKKDYKLLPHTKEPIYGLSTQSVQFMPWPITKFKVDKAWSLSQGQDVVVAVIDTGCDIHHEDILENILLGFNAINNSTTVMDGNGHGTHVTATISASNNSIGMVGVAPRTKILPVKALGDDGYGSNNSIAKGIMWSVDNGANIITMSLGSPHPSRILEKSLDYASKNNVLVFCAAGNSGNNTDILYPARYSNTISIGAINHKLEICEFSCCGDELDFLAPGEDIVSAAPGNNYTKMSGTSMATPFAVGCASLFLSSLANKKIDQKSLIEAFSKNTLKLKGRYSGDKKYEGNGIIQPILLTPPA